MSTSPPPLSPLAARFPLARVLLLVTLGGYLGLLTDIRLEHVDVVRKHWIPWIPILYSGLMALLSILALVRWTPGARRIVFWLSLLAFVVGGVGFWYHNDGKIVDAARSAARAWYDPKLKHPDDMPPPLAPLSFAGLGLLGLLATARRCQS
jgi:hypothetical protein